MCTFGTANNNCACISAQDTLPDCASMAGPQSGLQVSAPQGVNRTYAVYATTVAIGYNPLTPPSSRLVTFSLPPAFPNVNILFSMTAAEYSQLGIAASNKFGLVDTVIRLTSVLPADKLSLAGSDGILVRIDTTQTDGSCLPNSGVIVADLSANTPTWTAASDLCTTPFVYRDGCFLTALICRLPAAAAAKSGSSLHLQAGGSSDLLIGLGSSVPTDTVASVVFADQTAAVNLISGTVVITVNPNAAAFDQ
jgi:hypothetical protein